MAVAGEAAAVAKEVTLFFLPDLVAVEGIVEKESEVGIKLEGVAAVIDLLADFVFTTRNGHELRVEVGAASFAAFRRVDGAEEARQPRLHGAVGNLAGVVPLAPKRRGRQRQRGGGRQVAVVLAE